MRRFRKISAKEQQMIEVRKRFASFLQDYSNYRDMLTVQSGFKTSGAKNSYALYLARAIILYEENFEDRIDSLNSLESYNKIDCLRDSPQFKQYNAEEGRYPNAAINCYRDYLVYLNRVNGKEKVEDYESITNGDG